MKKLIILLLSILISLIFTSCKKLPYDTPSTSQTIKTQEKASSQEDASSESVISKVEEEKDVASKQDKPISKDSTSKVSSKKETSSKETVSNPSSTHKHFYTKKVVKPTCTKDGYTEYTCDCGKSYKDDKTDKLGHLYLDWEVTKKATTTSTGLKECKCDRCGKATITETIPKKKTAANIDSKVEITTRFGKTKYTLNKCDVLDTRTWGEAPTITVYNGDCMHVVYYNKKGKKVEFNVEQPPMDGYINGFTILDDGTYVSQLFGSYS